MLSEGTCKELLDEMKYNQFKKFNTADMNALEREMNFVQGKIDALKHEAETNDVTEALSVNFALLKAYSDRLERIAKAYRFYRFQRIGDSYFSKENLRGLLAAGELEFHREFSAMADEYLSDYRHLNLNDRHPPLCLFVQILALEDCGTVMCGDEFIELKKERIYFLRKSDVSHLLTKNLVKII